MVLGAAVQQAASALWLGSKLTLQHPYIAHLQWEADNMSTEQLTGDRLVFPLTARLTVWRLLRGERHDYVLIWLVATAL